MSSADTEVTATAEPGPGREPMPSGSTIADVARHAGVSKAAVSKVLRDAYGVSDAMRDRVNSAIRDLGYRPRIAARAMRGSSKTIGIQLPRLDNTFFSKILVGVVDRLVGTDFQIILAPMTRPAGGREALESLADRQVDGIIAVAPALPQAWLEELGSRIPLVQIGQHDDPDHYDVVTGDDDAGARLVMEHLFDAGHTRIAHFTVDQRELAEPLSDPHIARTNIYRLFMHGRGLSEDVLAISLTEEAAYHATRVLLSRPNPPTALFAGHDMLALGALQASTEMGLGPDRFAVVGYDDVAIAGHALIGLTTVDQLGEEMGSIAASLILDRMAGRVEPVRRQTQPVLRVRRTTPVAPPTV